MPTVRLVLILKQCLCVVQACVVNLLSGFLYGSHFVRMFTIPFLYLNISKSVHVWRVLESKLKWSGLARLRGWASPPSSCNLFLQTGLFLNLGLAVLAGLAGQRALRIHWLHTPTAGVTDSHQLLLGHWESQPGFLTIAEHFVTRAMICFKISKGAKARSPPWSSVKCN